MRSGAISVKFRKFFRIRFFFSFQTTMSSAEATIGSMIKQLFTDVPPVAIRVHRNHQQQGGGVNQQQHIPHHPNIQQNGRFDFPPKTPKNSFFWLLLRFFFELLFSIWLIEPWQTNGTIQNGGSPTTFTDSLTGKMFLNCPTILFCFNN